LKNTKSENSKISPTDRLKNVFGSPVETRSYKNVQRKKSEPKTNK
jgi:hypothetical protein|tara:strand:+ start:356 stop:490 length:135 start_codon:yes stop_codon:yes gene_type:complete